MNCAVNGGCLSFGLEGMLAVTSTESDSRKGLKRTGTSHYPCAFLFSLSKVVTRGPAPSTALCIFNLPRDLTVNWRSPGP